MSPHLVPRSGLLRPGALLLAALFSVLATAGPAVASCCVMRATCCPGDISGQDHDRTELKAPLPQCCQELVPGSRAPLAGRAAQAPGALLAAVMSEPPAALVAPQAAILVPAPRADAPADVPESPSAARAPPRT